MSFKIKLKKGWQKAFSSLAKESLRKTYHVLREAINIPNTITLIRALLVLPIIELYQSDRSLAFVLYLTAVVTDFLDGLCARKLNQKTDFGKIIDPIADKLLNYTVIYFLFLDKYDFKTRFWVMVILAFILLGMAGLKLLFPIRRKLGSNIFGKMKFGLESLAVIFLFLNLGKIAIGLINWAIVFAIFSILGHLLIKEDFSFRRSLKKYFQSKADPPQAKKSK